jgi:hypothetical protein
LVVAPQVVPARFLMSESFLTALSCTAWGGVV